MSPIKVVFICTGNTCRSPMAAAMATQIFTDAGLAAEVSSAGVSAFNKQPASRHAVKVMGDGGLCLLSHRAELVSAAILESANLVFTMTDSHRAVLHSDYPALKEKTFTLAEYVGDDINIADPFGGNEDEYRACAAQIRKLLELAVKKIKEENK